MTSKSPAAKLSDKSLKDLTVVELKDLCRDRGIKGYAHKPKATLLEMVEADGSGASAKSPSAADQSAAATPSRSRSSRSGLKKKSKAGKASSQKQKKGRQGELEGDLASRTIVQLRQFCKDQGIQGFARKTKQQLLDLINSSTVATESSGGQPETDVEKGKDHDLPGIDNAPMDEPDSDHFYSEDSKDLDTNGIVQEEPDDELSSAELDVVKGSFEDQFDGNGESAMVEVSDSLIFEVLDRFDRIEALLQRIAGSVDRP